LLSKTFWLRTAIIVPASILAHLLLQDRAELSKDIGGVAAFVTAIGTLYSVLTAFTVVSVWTEFTDTDRAIKREARDLSELWRYVTYVSDKVGAARARSAIERYRDEVISVEWPAMVAGQSVAAAEDEFLAMADAVNAIDVVTPRDVPAWAESVRTLGSVSDARGERIVLLGLRMPRLLRWLLFAATFSLVGGMILLSFENDWIGSTVVGSTAAISLLVLEVIDDIDDPIGGAWGISVEPFQRIKFERREARDT
jgi:hypothetical protein